MSSLIKYICYHFVSRWLDNLKEAISNARGNSRRNSNDSLRASDSQSSESGSFDDAKPPEFRPIRKSSSKHKSMEFSENDSIAEEEGDDVTEDVKDDVKEEVEGESEELEESRTDDVLDVQVKVDEGDVTEESGKETENSDPNSQEDNVTHTNAKVETGDSGNIEVNSEDGTKNNNKENNSSDDTTNDNEENTNDGNTMNDNNDTKNNSSENNDKSMDNNENNREDNINSDSEEPMSMEDKTETKSVEETTSTSSVSWQVFESPEELEDFPGFPSSPTKASNQDNSQEKSSDEKCNDEKNSDNENSDLTIELQALRVVDNKPQTEDEEELENGSRSSYTVIDTHEFEEEWVVKV